MSRKTGNAQSRATFFRDSAVLCLPAVLLRKVSKGDPWPRGAINRPFPSSPQSLFQGEFKCKIFVLVISSNFNMNEN